MEATERHKDEGGGMWQVELVKQVGPENPEGNEQVEAVGHFENGFLDFLVEFKRRCCLW